MPSAAQKGPQQLRWASLRRAPFSPPASELCAQEGLHSPLDAWKGNPLPQPRNCSASKPTKAHIPPSALSLLTCMSPPHTPSTPALSRPVTLPATGHHPRPLSVLPLSLVLQLHESCQFCSRVCLPATLCRNSGESGGLCHYCFLRLNPVFKTTLSWRFLERRRETHLQVALRS